MCVYIISSPFLLGQNLPIIGVQGLTRCYALIKRIITRFNNVRFSMLPTIRLKTSNTVMCILRFVFDPMRFLYE